jgi:ribosomal protein S18 acetylase RimI-like enzyme
MTDIRIHRIESFRAGDVAGAIGRIYRDAYHAPDDEVQAFVGGAFPKHANWPGFLLLVATFENIPVGFIYGYNTRPGQWWHDTIRPAMVEAECAAWQDGAFELAEVAVDPVVQGRGIGTALIETFLADVGGRTVLLSTMADPADRAKDLYRRFGFTDLVPEFFYPGSDEAAIIMGRRGEAS